MPKAKLAELVKECDEASKIKNPRRPNLLNDSDKIHVTQSPTTKKAAFNLVSPNKESVARMQSSTDFPIDLSTPEKKLMARTLKLTTQKSIEGLLTKVLLKETEDAAHTLLQKEFNAEPTDNLTFDNDLEDTPNRDVRTL
jgi:hypothetical protein